jgi:large subunit ribosomal protein L25
MITLNVLKREATVKASQLRKDGFIPAVAYGKKQAPVNLSIAYAEFIRAYNKGGETTLMQFEIDGKKINSLIQDISLDPVTNKVAHIDFYVPEAGKKVTTSVPVHFIGESAAVKAGGILVKVLQEIEVEALPENLPHSIDVDTTLMLTLEDSVKISDIKFPAGVTCTLDADEVIAAVVAPKEESDEPAEPIDLSKIEVEKKGKKEEEAESAE